MKGDNIQQIKEELIHEIEQRRADHIIEETNAKLIMKLIHQAESINEAISIAELGTTYKRTGLHFDKRIEKMGNDIYYFKKNEQLSFQCDPNKKTNKLIIGDNYHVLQNLLISYRKSIDLIYIDPPYSKDAMGNFAQTNYENEITRDNLLSALYPRLLLAKQLLSRDGILFCSIDDKNQSYVKCLLDEIFDEKNFLFVAPRITKKGGKSTALIQKNHDYIIAYTLSNDILFSQQEKDASGYIYRDEYWEERGPYILNQTLDYDTLGYVNTLDYPIELEGEIYYPGKVNQEQYEKRKKENPKDGFRWRWSKDLVDFGKKNGWLVVNKKTGRIYTKTYLNAMIKKTKDGYQIIDKKNTKPYTTLSFLENENSNDNGKKELDKIFKNANRLFKNPKPSKLVENLIKMATDNKEAVILDFYAGSGTTGQAVMELNRQDQGNRTFILCTNNEITEENPNGIAYDVTSKRLKRVMTGKCYDGSSDFSWRKDHKPYLENLDVYQLETVNNAQQTEGKNVFDSIDETLYDMPKFVSIQEKIAWICQNFEKTQKYLEED